MTRYDLCLAWNWEYDRDFAGLLDSACRERGLRLLQVTPDSLGQSLSRMQRGELSFRTLLDRASPADPLFRPLIERARRLGVFEVNPAEAAWSQDKAAMHLALLEAGVRTPYTILLPPYAEWPGLPDLDLSPLGERFTIKPAHGGGGEGVIVGATEAEQALMARQEHPHDTYLLQAQVEPRVVAGRREWFRCLYCAGQSYLCWWDTDTHIYLPVTEADESALGLVVLPEILTRIAEITRMRLFSTEIARNVNGDFMVVDYVNDQIDLRLQSAATDGVPDAIVTDIAARLSDLAAGSGRTRIHHK